MILRRVGRSHRKGLHSGRKTARLSYFARGSSLSYFVAAHSGVQCPSSAARRCDSLSPLFTRLPNLPRPAAVDPQPCGNPDVAEAPSDHGQRPRGRGCRHSHDVGQYVGDDPCCLAAVVDALIEPICAAQGFADTDAEPVRGLLLQGRTGERWRLALWPVSSDRPHPEPRVSDALHRCRNCRVQAEILVPGRPSIEPGERRPELGTARREHLHADGPVLPQEEALDLRLVFASSLSATD